VSRAIPSYVWPSWRWLLDNLHNPYPSKSVRATISHQTHSPMKDIDAWFSDVRKRIGWNSIRRKHFSNRHDLIEAATDFFQKHSPEQKRDHSVRVNSDVFPHFAAMELSAKALYDGRSLPGYQEELHASPSTRQRISQNTRPSKRRQVSSSQLSNSPSDDHPSSAGVTPRTPKRKRDSSAETDISDDDRHTWSKRGR